MEQSIGQYTKRIYERCLMWKLQCIVKVGMWLCMQCKRFRVGCVFGWVTFQQLLESSWSTDTDFRIAKAIETKVGDNSISYLTLESTPNSHSIVPHLDSNIVYRLLGGSLLTTLEALNVSQTKGDNSTNYLSLESTVPYLVLGIAYRLLGGNRTQQVLGQPTKSGA